MPIMKLRSFIFILLFTFSATVSMMVGPLRADESHREHERMIYSASELYYPPFSIIREDGTADGFSVELMTAVARSVNLDVTFKVGPWSEIKAELIDGRLDALPLVSYSEERDERMDFTVPYLRMHGAIFVRKGEEAIKSESDLKGKQIVVMRGDTAQEYLMKKNLTDHLVLTDSYETAMKKLSAGQYDAVVVQNLVGLQLIRDLGITNVIRVKSFHETSLKPRSAPLSGFEQNFCIAVQEGDEKLLSLLNEGLALVIANGQYDRLYNKWFGPILPERPISLARKFKYVLYTTVPFIAFTLLMGIWMMRREVARKTRALKEQMKISEEAEDAFQTSEKRLKTLIDTLPDLIWLKDTDGHYLFCNNRFERFFGATEEEIIGKTDYDFVDREKADFFRKYDQIAIDKGKSITNEEAVVFADDGHHEILETIKTPMYGVNGELVGVLGIGRDITGRKQTEEQLQHAQKMESIGRLAGGVAHDYNNMLSVILGYTELCLEKIAPSDPLHGDLTEIYNAAGRSVDITGQLLAFARKQTIVPKVVDLNALIESTLKMLRRLIGEDIELVWRGFGGLWCIKVDPIQVDQILANLCVNARDAITGVGKIVIETRNVAIDETYCVNHEGAAPGEYVMLAIRDNGAGMDKETIRYIFDPFFTTKEIDKGTGLGLSTIYGIVKQNNGFINVCSEIGKGSTFKIHLPRYDGNVQEKIPERESRKPTGRGESILLVEDEPAIRKMAQSMLKRLGYEVLAAGTPGEAVAMAKENRGTFDLLMSDVVMPEMNGRDLSRKISDICPDVKTLFMSGYTANVISDYGVVEEGTNFIQKPFSVKELGSKIKSVMGSRST